jgi:hypothetical protein
MNKYVIYLGNDGYTKARLIKEGETEQDVIAKANQAGFEVLRDRAIVGSDPADAVMRFDKAQKLRGEAKEIYKNVESPQAIEAYTKQMDQAYKSADEAKRKQKDYEEAQALTDTDNTFNAQATLKQMGRSIPKLATSAYQAIVNPEDLDGDGKPDRMQTFADRYILPYESDLAQATLGDPTLVPSMMVPGVGEAKVAQILQKGSKYVPKITELAKPTKYAIDAGVQSGITSAVNDADFVENTALGTAMPVVAGAVGRGMTAGGGKIMQAVLKPKERHLERFAIEDLMSAKNPDGSNVVGAFNTMDKVDSRVQGALDEYAQMQLAELQRVPEGVPMDFMESRINDKIDELIRQTKAKVGAGLNPDEAKKTIDILNRERESLLRRGRGVEAIKDETQFLMPTGTESPSELASLQTVHDTKQAFGAKGRYDVTDQATSDPTVRNAYRNLYGTARDAITDTEVHLKEMATNPQYAKTFEDYSKRKNKLEGLWANIVETQKNLSSLDPALVKTALGMIDRNTEYIKKEVAQLKPIEESLAKMREGKSIYDKSSKQMAPLMTASEVLTNAEKRTSKHNPFSLTGTILAGGAFMGTQSPYATALALLAPQAIQSMPTGTALYRGGEALQRGAGSRYAVPLMIRANEE